MSTIFEAQTPFNESLCHTPSIWQMRDFFQAAVTHDLPVLLTGETGTGKTYLARLIHECSPRRDHPLAVVPCGALVSSLIESELFGHAKGAFTGADRSVEGRFAAAGAGTILLDEIDALGLAQQANLLRIIETGEYEPVGSTQTQYCQARLMFACNVNLDDAVQQGRFRTDLFYRINVLSFYLPPLRERVEDIAPLAMGIVARACAKCRRPLLAISAEAQAALEAYSWPGNIRQLENVLSNAVLFSSGAELLLKHLPRPIQERAARAGAAVAAGDGSLGRTCELHERSLIQRALAACDYNCTEAARTLKVSRTTLYKKIKKYGLMDGAASGMAESAGAVSNSAPVRETMRAARYRRARLGRGEMTSGAALANPA
jgi:DNA-binding NtrC family response regulator